MTDVPGNPFEAVSLVRKRAQQITAGAEPRVRIRHDDNPVSVALEELAAGHLRPRSDVPKQD